MNYKVLYRTYRPQRFDEVVGQDYIIKVLKNAINTQRIAHAYLFAGPRGTGKTTIAKLFAKAINCEHFNEEACNECQNCIAFNSNNHPDIIELDAASNNKVEDIREIIEQVAFSPILGKYKIYIVDEVHMLTPQAFNALLKTLEEPPEHVIFILATTDPQKIIPTVLSRCQRYNFSKISNLNMKKKMIEILNKEKLKYDEKALEEIAMLAEGGMRDALSILEQVLSYNNEGIFLDDVQKIFGLSTKEEKKELLINIHHDLTKAISVLRQMYESGIDPKRLCIDLLEIIKESLIYSDSQNETLLNKINKFDAMDILDMINTKDLFNDISFLEEALNKSRSNQSFLTYLELAVIKMGKQTSTKKENDDKGTKTKKETDIQSDDKQKEEPEKVIETVSKEEKDEQNTDIEYLAALLLTANKNEKISDSIIYNRLEMFKLDPYKRKYYELLKNTDLFASGKDVIIVTGPKLYIDNINQKENRNELYKFLMDEFGLDKIVLGVEDNKCKDLVAIYKNLALNKNNKAPIVHKPIINKEKTNEEKAIDLFDNVRIED